MSLDIQKQMQINFVHFCSVLNQKKIEFKDLEGNNHQGIVQNVTPTQKTLLIKSSSQNQPLKLWRLDQIGFLKLSQIAKFKIDSETVKTKDRKAKTLVKWVEEDDKQDSILDATPQNHFDQFEANLERFGVMAFYDENSYTTELKLNQVNEKLKDYAEQQAYDLVRFSQEEKNPHILEERNLKPLQDEEDEEAQYSAVMGSGKYKNFQKKQKGKNKNKFPPGLLLETPVIESPELSASKTSNQSAKFYNSSKSPVADFVEQKEEQQKDIVIPVELIHDEEKPIEKPKQTDVKKRLKLRKNISDQAIGNFNVQSVVINKNANECVQWQDMVPDQSKNKMEGFEQIVEKPVEKAIPQEIIPNANQKKSLKQRQQNYQDSFLTQLDPKNIGQDPKQLKRINRPLLNVRNPQPPYQPQPPQYAQPLQYAQPPQYAYQFQKYPPQNQFYYPPPPPFQNQQYQNNTQPYYQDYQQNQFYQYPQQEYYDNFQYQLPPPPHQ